MSFAASYRYKWVAHLCDGRSIPQFDELGAQTLFDSLAELAIDYLEVVGLAHPLVIAFAAGAKPVIFQRVQRDSDGVREIERRFHYFGWERGEEQHIVVIHEETGLLAIENQYALIRGG